MSDHTPDFHEVRGAYISWLPAMFTEKRVAEFDRFIAKVKADALREAADMFSGRLGNSYSGLAVRGMLSDSADRIEEEA